MMAYSRSDTDPRRFNPSSCLAQPYGGLQLACPACNFECVHLSRVEVDRGGDVVEVDADGVGFGTRPCTARGAITTLDFFCEAGHRFALEGRFHKGATFVRCELLPEDRTECPRTLWRD